MLRVMLVGCGRWGRNYVRVLDSEPGIELARIIDPRFTMQDGLQDARIGRHAPQDLSAVDAVIIATPAHTHYALVGFFLEQGKHVLCEKPLCKFSEMATVLHATARDRGLVLRTGHIYQYNPLVQRLREGVEMGVTGKVHSVFFRQAGPGPVRGDVGVIFDRAVHGLSIFQAWLQSAPRLVSATGCGEGPAEATLALTYPGDIMGTISVSWRSHQKECYGWVNGSRHTLWFDDCLKWALMYRDGTPTGRPDIPATSPLTSQIRAFATAIRDGLPNHADMDYAIVATLVAARRSYEARGEPITVKGVSQ